MSWGESNLVRPDSGTKILYRGTLNSYGKIDATGLTQDNRPNAQALANTTLSASTPVGILAGSVVAVTGAGTVGKATNASTGVVGIAVNDAVGAPYESASGAGSGKLVYLHGSTSLIAASRYETYDDAGSTPLNYAAAYGAPVYASKNGLLTIAAGINGGAGSAVIVGIIVEPPTASNPLLVVQLRV
jgi:hypothetical protein